jgi:cobalt-zinc-cadmium efflux system membrane fusion protein
MKKTIKIILVFVVVAISSCSNQTNEQTQSQVENKEEINNGLFQISEAQFSTEGMELGSVRTMKFKKEITCNGYINASRNGEALVSSHISGLVETINVSIGDKVKKGQILCTLSSNDFISLQEYFTVTSAKLKVAKKSYERNKKLFKQNVGSEKDYNLAESEYKSNLAKFNSLKKRLEMLKLNVSNIERGRLYSFLPIYSPIEGHVASRNIVLGEHVDSSVGLMKIVNNKELQLILSIFEKDVNKLMVGQEVKFSSIGDFSKEFNAKISMVGRTINKESKTIKCVAKIDNVSSLNFVNDSFVNAKIIVGNSEAKAISSQAIIKSGKDNYVLVNVKKESGIYYFEKVKVETGSSFNGFTEILNDVEMDNILVKGVYNIILD